jgi:hypothetical protein
VPTVVELATAVVADRRLHVLVDTGGSVLDAVTALWDDLVALEPV